MNPDTLHVATQVVQNSTTQQVFGIELAKLFIFSIFVTAALEVAKEVYKRFDANGMQEQTTKIFNFALALLFCYAFDYGVMSRLIEVGAKARQGLSGWLDYIGTAGLIYMGADWVFNKFSAAIEKAKAAKALAKSVTTSDTVTQSSSQTQTTSSTMKP